MDSDEALVERFRVAREEAAFNALVERHRQDVYRLAYRIAGNHEDAHDLAQEAFVRVYQSLDKFRGDAAFKTWLFRIVVNLSLNHIRRTRKEREGRVEVEEGTLSVAATGLADVLDSERRAELQGAIEKLPDKQRKTLILKVFHELKYTEIARVMSCSVGTAKANFFHAVQSLRKHMGVARVNAGVEG